MTLSLEKKQAIKASDNKSTRKRKSVQTQEKILDYLKDNGRSTCAEIAGYIGLSPARTRAILSQIESIEPLGQKKNRTYRLNKTSKFIACFRHQNKR